MRSTAESARAPAYDQEYTINDRIGIIAKVASEPDSSKIYV